MKVRWECSKCELRLPSITILDHCIFKERCVSYLKTKLPSTVYLKHQLCIFCSLLRRTWLMWLMLLVDQGLATFSHLGAFYYNFLSQNTCQRFCFVEKNLIWLFGRFRCVARTDPIVERRVFLYHRCSRNRIAH